MQKYCSFKTDARIIMNNMVEIKSSKLRYYGCDVQ